MLEHPSLYFRERDMSMRIRPTMLWREKRNLEEQKHPRKERFETDYCY